MQRFWTTPTVATQWLGAMMNGSVHARAGRRRGDACDRVRLTVLEPIALIDMSPRMGPRQQAVADELNAAIVAAERTVGARAIVLATSVPMGPEPDVCTDGMNEMPLELDGVMGVVDSVCGTSVPVVVSVEGGTVTGLELAISCAADVLIAHRGATFRLAGVVPMPTWTREAATLLADALGRRYATHLALVGGQLSAAEGERIGFVSELVDDAAARDRARSVATELACGSTFSHYAWKRAFDRPRPSCADGTSRTPRETCASENEASATGHRLRELRRAADARRHQASAG